MSDWRHRAAGDALARYVEAVPVGGPALVLGDPHPRGADAFEEAGCRVVRWDRVLREDVEVSPWPPEGGFSTAAIRLPKAKDELEMLVHAAVARLEPGGALLVYGANDEGIRSAGSRLSPLVGPVDTVMHKNRCRVVRAERPVEVPELRPTLEAWRQSWILEVDGREREWVSYPGVFAHGRLDPGTALLLDVLPSPAPGSRVLDFGCGSGVVGGVLLEREPSLQMDLLDVDTVALEAARLNVPDGRTVLGGGVGELETGPYAWIVSNPPYHDGKAETLEAATALIREAPDRLTRDGVLALVVQRRLPVEEHLDATFSSVESLGADETYRVWRGRRPLRR